MGGGHSKEKRGLGRMSKVQKESNWNSGKGRGWGGSKEIADQLFVACTGNERDRDKGRKESVENVGHDITNTIVNDQNGEEGVTGIEIEGSSWVMREDERSGLGSCNKGNGNLGWGSCV